MSERIPTRRLGGLVERAAFDLDQVGPSDTNILREHGLSDLADLIDDVRDALQFPVPTPPGWHAPGDRFGYLSTPSVTGAAAAERVQCIADVCSMCRDGKPVVEQDGEWFHTLPAKAMEGLMVPARRRICGANGIRRRTTSDEDWGADYAAGLRYALSVLTELYTPEEALDLIRRRYEQFSGEVAP